MKKTTTNKILFLAIIAITYIVLLALAGIIGDFNSDFFEGLAFLSIAAILAIGVVAVYGSKDTSVTDIFFHMPIYIFGAGYYIIAGLLSFLHMLIGLLSFKVFLIIQIVLLAVFLINVIKALISMNTAKNATRNVQMRNDFIRTMSAKLDSIAGLTSDRELQQRIEALAEEFKYSKPAAHKDLNEIESLLEKEVGNLEQAVNKNENTDKLLETIKSMLLERNNIANFIK